LRVAVLFMRSWNDAVVRLFFEKGAVMKVIILNLLILIGLAGSVVLWCGCPIDGEDFSAGELVVMTWNVQNLMDGIVDGTEYDEYLPAAGWNDALYRKRLKRCVAVVTDKASPLPHILILQEIENDRVLVDLLEQRLARLGFLWHAATGELGNAIQIGVASRLPITSARVHSVPGCRPVLECGVETSSGTIIILAVHGKSRKEGVTETEADRISLSKTIQTLLSEWRENDPSALVLVAGDFNESPDAQVSDGASWQTAFVEAAHPKAFDYYLRGSLMVSGNRSVVPGDASVLYSPWLDGTLRFDRPGSCWFSGGWHRYDQVLGDSGLFDGVGWEFSGSGVSTPDVILSPEGTPFAWNVRSRSGVSDHFPVWIRLRRSSGGRDDDSPFR